ncbi:hypothetical protein M406DRAFT_248703 [Cryphonectria parasitica EP155]|uniref:Uncharacterized protein n=1 Tax=Cryphonectria parasitica (strain ATCC 38755 / EP155) TaxID=660469 RepID=A0A9P5CUA1_CRYP1|nr:uncharacterized protein M406DRAFT_248703 [Cryphonectria parasitica EP155]KAF3770256.1 hypothetical protein M406DRAFT_248703 [Cryphonectria parasitica EP155]
MPPVLTAFTSPQGPLLSLRREVYRLTGFQKGYNFLLWCIFAVGSLIFSLSRVGFLDYFGVFCRRNHLSRGHHAAPGECYYFLNGGQEQIGMMLHLYSIIPCCILLFFQFIPVFRQRWVLFHRINGHAVILLMGVAIVGALMALPGSFGGDAGWQAMVLIHSTMIITGLTLAMANIRSLQIEQHRAWMLRTWIWAFCTITMRAIQQIAARVLSKQGHVALRPCAQIMSDGVLPAAVIEQKWPGCAAFFSGESLDQTVLVSADYYGLPIEINVALSIASGLSGFLALLVHVIGAEIYLHLTPAESERLRHISYHKQVAAGLRYPGRAGLTADRFGDAALWCPHVEEKGHVDDDSLSIRSTDPPRK